MEIYFSSDLHLGHRSVIGFQNRPFENVEEMDNGIIHNFNSVVHRDDILYILGDLSYRIPESQANELIKRINGRKILIRGNHDGHYDKSLFEEIYDYNGGYNEENRMNGILRYDVGVDANNYYPVSLRYIRSYFADSDRLRETGIL